MHELLQNLLRPYIVHPKLKEKYNLSDEEIAEIQWNMVPFYDTPKGVLNFYCYHKNIGNLEVLITDDEFKIGFIKFLTTTTTAKAKGKK